MSYDGAAPSFLLEYLFFAYQAPDASGSQLRCNGSILRAMRNRFDAASRMSGSFVSEPFFEETRG